MIPRIIHQTAPDNKSNWHPLWHPCQQSWLTNFADAEYKMWSDSDIDQLIEQHYPQYWSNYCKFPVHIMRIDFVRFAIMHHVGGIYADMDYYCYSNFYNELTNSVYLVENPYGNDPIENSLMCSEPGHPFWIQCMDLSMRRMNYVLQHRPDLFEYIKTISSDIKYGLKLRPYLVFYITGTNALSTAFRNSISDQSISTLSALYFNNNDISYDPSYRARHIHTGLWGQENQQLVMSYKEPYQTLRNIPIDSFDFYFDYSFGRYLKQDYQLDISKNDIESEFLQIPTNYTYI